MAPSKHAIRIVIADDHAMFRDGLRKLLNSCNDLTTVGEASNGKKCLRILPKLKPDILLLDLQIPGDGGLGVLEKIDLHSLPTRVIVLAEAKYDREVVAAMRLGARGAVLKQSASNVLLKSIRKVHDGEIWLDARLTTKVFETLRRLAAARRQKPLLSDREREIVQLVAQGFRNREIGAKLSISEQTVKNHIHNIFDKVGVSDRLELALYAVHHHWFEEDNPRTPVRLPKSLKK
jgi:two-component system, NarL family, nitrate/nitrite response regulator NarL